MEITQRLIATFVLFFSFYYAGAQDSTARINYAWYGYAQDTALTYRQIVTICDSLFDLAGYPVFADTAIYEDTLQGSDTAQAEGEPEENSPFNDYLKWRDFWSTRLDGATGKLHNFASDAILELQADTGELYGSMDAQPGGGGCTYNPHSITPATSGWRFIGPQNIATTPPVLDAEPAGINTLHEHLGQVNKILVNPNNSDEVYVSTPWGGLWKTSNASAAPNNTWVSLTDHDWWCKGMGVVDFDIDFTPGSPHKIFIIAGYIDKQLFLYNPDFTVGIMYSPDDGANWGVVQYTSGNDNFTKIKLYPGNSSSSTKYLFATSHYRLARFVVSHAWTTSVPFSSYTITDMRTLLPADGSLNTRFRGFSEMAFRITPFAQQLFVSTLSNVGLGYPTSCSLYKLDGCTLCAGAGCVLNDISASMATPVDFLEGVGTFSSPPGYQWWVSPPWNWNGSAMALAAPTSPVNLETAVAGSYAATTTYTVTFTLTLPAKTEVDVFLRDAPDPFDFSSGAGTMGADVPVGPGDDAGATSLGVGRYTNTGTSSTPYSQTYSIVCTSPHYVDRLVFSGVKLAGYGSGNIILDDVTVVQPYQDFVYNLLTSPATSAANSIYCFSGVLGGTSGASLKKIDLATTYPYDVSSVSSVFVPGTVTWGNKRFAIGAYDPDIAYFYSIQAGWGPSVQKMNFSVGGTPVDDPTSMSNHTDCRYFQVMSNGSGDDLYMGNDGGISKGKFGGPWTSLNGTGLGNSLAMSVGSSIHSGDVAVATGDNGTLITNETNLSAWRHLYGSDGGEIKFGMRYETRGEHFRGYSSGGGFARLDIINNGNPSATSFFNMTVKCPAINKVRTTFNNEYFGTNNAGGDVRTLANAPTGAGTTTSPFNLLPFRCPTCLGVSSGFYRKPVQAIGADLYNKDYLALFVHTRFWDYGNLEYSTNASATSPTWRNGDGTTPVTDALSAPVASGIAGEFIIDLAVDPRSSNSSKRLWAGCGWYRPAGYHRVYQSTDGGNSWSDYSTGLPSGPVNALAYDEQSHYLFAGTDEGVYLKNVDDPYCPWSHFFANPSFAFVTGLDINRCTGKLYASTYGRGAFEVDLPPAYNWNGTGTGGTTDFCDIDAITGTLTAPTFWTQDKDEIRTIYIGPGKALVIQNCTVNMARNKNIIVDVGGSLVIDGATITNTCGTMWGTISVLGNPAVDQDLTNMNDAVSTTSVPYSSSQGFLRLKRYTSGGAYRDPVIENSYLAVLAADQYYDGSDVCDYAAGKEGGLICADRATFHNCATSIAFKSYHHVNHSYVSDCHFLSDEPLHSSYYVNYSAGASLPRPYGSPQDVVVDDNWEVSFWNDTFETRDNTGIGFVPDKDIRGVGLQAYSSRTSVHNCYFLNKTRGILAYDWIWNQDTWVFDSKFTGCWRSMSITGWQNAICYNNTITMGGDIPYSPHSEFDMAHFLDPVGIYYTHRFVIPYTPYGMSYSMNHFHINENTVYYGGGAHRSYGIIGWGYPGNTMYKNTVNGCSYGIDAETPFQLKCNTLNYNVVGLAIPLSTQGSCADPAANRFFVSGYQHQAIGAILGPVTNYYTYSNSPYVIDPARVNEVVQIPCSPDITCNSNFDDCCPSGGATVVRIGGSGTGALTLSEVLNGISGSETHIPVLTQKLKAGNDESLLDIIHDEGASESEVSTALIGVGPYLSDTVLIAAINRSPSLSYNTLKTIIISNSALSQPVWDEMASKDTAMAADTDVINVQVTQSSRKIAEDSLNYYYSLRNEYISAVKMYYDSLRNWDTLANFYALRHEYIMAFSYYLQNSDWTNAQVMIDSVTDTAYAHLMSIQLQHVHQGISLDTLSSADSATLVSLAQDRSTNAGDIAYMWYVHAKSLPYFEYRPYDTSYTSSGEKHDNISDTSKSISNGIQSNVSISAYPNPANEVVTLSIKNGSWNGATITVTDVYGRKVKSFKPTLMNSNIPVETKSWMSGLYVFHISFNNGAIYTLKVIIKKE